MIRLNRTTAFQTALALVCGAVSALGTVGTPVQLTKDDVETIIANAATEASRIDPRAVIAVTDRDGFVLAVWDMGGRIPSPVPPFSLSDRSKIAIYGKLAGAITPPCRRA